jgi:16S rRNA G966 N2-methylase RsmD
MEKMDLIKLSKSDLLLKCEELGFTKCKSKNKAELIGLINSKTDIPTNKIEETFIPNEAPENTIIHAEGGDMGQVIINNNVSYFNKDILQFNTDIKFDLIYLDPPYETNRTFTVNSLDDETGFEDVWEDNNYQEWIDKLIRHLSAMLSTSGTLVFHISSENSFIAECVLRKYFKKIQKIFQKQFKQFKKKSKKFPPKKSRKIPNIPIIWDRRFFYFAFYASKLQ